MKIAICIVGNPRSFKRTFSSFKENLLKNINADIFIHTFENTGQERSDVTVDGTTSEYINLYKPNLNKVDKIHFDFQHLNNMEPYFRSCYEVVKLVENYEEQYNFKYDILIKTRADILYLEPLNKKILEIIYNNKNTIFVNHVCYNNQYYYNSYEYELSPELAAQKSLEKNIFSFKMDKKNNSEEHLPNDYIFLGDRKSMQIALEEPYKNISKLIEFSPGGERLLNHVINSYNINYGLSTLYLKVNCLR